MTRGKPWNVEEETVLKDLIEAKTPMESIGAKLTRQPDAIYIKCLRLGLKEPPHSVSIEINLPKELPTIEETAKMMAAALETLKEPGLNKTEILRLHSIISGAKVYKEILARLL